MQSIPETKTCTKCKHSSPLDHFIGRKGQPTVQCADCRQKALDDAKSKRNEDPDAYRENQRRKMRQYRAQDRERTNRKARERLRQYRKENPAKFREYEQRRSPEVKALRKIKQKIRNARRSKERIEYNRQWRKRNKDLHYAQLKRYKERNPLAGAIKAQRRRARILKADGEFTVAEFKQLCDAYGNKCLACGSTGRLTADHVVPLSSGGAHSIDNIQPLCGPCNSRKNTKTIDYRLKVMPCSNLATSLPVERS